ncbi:unnamed protein product [Pleuronectes platessa]|uniref:Uncharacterized protein n=1 Tax=Pleuronectes platessa TaxID=8262 RepID=A0A9N7UN56_PLEPL|nr:unnamed protein product [Pleuronectes platessa]
MGVAPLPSAKNRTFLLRPSRPVLPYILSVFLSSPLFVPPYSERAPRLCPEATVLGDDGLGWRVLGSGGGCGALQCSMTDGNMYYFPGGLSQRRPECIAGEC